MYEDATKEELIDRITQLERHVIQLKNVIAKSQVFYLSLFILLLLISSYDPYASSYRRLATGNVQCVCSATYQIFFNILGNRSRTLTLNPKP